MDNHFFTLTQTEQAALIRKAADQLSMPEAIIEKDIWIYWYEECNLFLHFICK